MAFGASHAFPCRPGETPAGACKATVPQIEAAGRWGLEAIWLTEIPQRPDHWLHFGAPIPPERVTNALRLLCEQVMPRCR